MEIDKIIVVRDATGLEYLVKQFNSKEQAKFYLDRAGEDFESYKLEHNNFYEVLNRAVKSAEEYCKIKVLDKSFVSKYLFSGKELVIVIGRDGLLANVAKYANNIQIIGINPNPESISGKLMKFTIEDLSNVLSKVFKGKHNEKQTPLAEAKLNNGQSLLAFNDFYIGSSMQVSSYYQIEYKGKTENHISSGIIVSTFAGSSGWLNSLFNMAGNLTQQTIEKKYEKWNMETKKLVFAVREPYKSQISDISIGLGIIENTSKLKISSRMTQHGIIFSDGVLSDFLEFNSGKIVKIGLANANARIVYP